MWERLLIHAQKYPLEYLVNGVLLLPAFIGLIRWKWEGRAIRLAVIYFFVSFGKVSITIWYALNRWYNIHIYNAFLVVDTLLLGSVFVLAASSPRQKSLLSMLIVVGCSIIGLGIGLSPNTPEPEFSTIGNAVYRLTLILIVLITFFWWLVQLRVHNLLMYPLFWLSAGLLLYTTGTFFMYLFSYYAFAAEAPSARFLFYWEANQGFYIVFCLLAAGGFWVSKYSLNN